MSQTSLKIAIAAGGTAGHINPALALAEELTERGHKVVFFGQATRLEASLVPEAGFDFVPIDVRGFDRSKPWTLVSALIKMAKAEGAVSNYFKDNGKVDVAIGFGAYVELPLLRTCVKEHIPTLIHEQNSTPGLANKLSSQKARTVCVAFPAAIEAFRPKAGADTQIIVTGNPVRKQILNASFEAGRANLHIDKDKEVLLVFGGSLGARHINRAIASMKDELLSRKNLYIVQSTGKDDFESCKEDLALTKDEEKRWKLMPYISNMGEILAASDLVVSRAGASSLAEIAALHVPSVLIPYPYATADHQSTNAKFLVDAKAAITFSDSELDAADFKSALLELIDNKEARLRMRHSAEGLGQDKAASILADQVEIACGQSPA